MESPYECDIDLWGTVSYKLVLGWFGNVVTAQSNQGRVLVITKIIPLAASNFIERNYC